MSQPVQRRFVSRAGLKLDQALDAFGLDVAGWVCADFGCNVGGFTDCLLQRGAGKVYAIDTGYGALAWKLRKDSRVVVMERTNALYARPAEPVDLVVIDMAWTIQELSIPAALRWLRVAGGYNSWVISLLKPHYELAKLEGLAPRGILGLDRSREVCQCVCQRLADGGVTVAAVVESGLTGKGGNREFFLLVPGRPGETGQVVD
jgi:23S rRNA (cytidine1920-2'-O)/16S rRNA (cytidine1409-2'-O)-methyltransferase